MGVIIEGKNRILSYTLMPEKNEPQTLCTSVTHDLKCFFTTFSTPVTASYAPTQPSSQDILTFFWFLSHSSKVWRWWAVPQPHSRTWQERGIFLLQCCLQQSADQCIMGWLPWPWQPTCASQRGFWNNENQKALGNRLNKHLPRALEVSLTFPWCACSLKAGCHIDNDLWSAVQVLLFEIPWYMYKNSFVLIASQKTRVTLKAVRPKVMSSNWFCTAVLLRMELSTPWASICSRRAKCKV